MVTVMVKEKLESIEMVTVMVMEIEQKKVGVKDVATEKLQWVYLAE